MSARSAGSSARCHGPACSASAAAIRLAWPSTPARSLRQASVMASTRCWNCARREVGAAVERRTVRGHEHGHRPAALAGHGLGRGHVHRVHVGPFLPVHLDGHEVVVQQRRGLRNPRTTRAPSRGTSDRPSSRPTASPARPARAPPRTPPVTTATSRPGCPHAAGDKGSSRSSAGLPYPHLRLRHPPAPHPGSPAVRDHDSGGRATAVIMGMWPIGGPHPHDHRPLRAVRRQRRGGGARGGPSAVAGPGG